MTAAATRGVEWPPATWSAQILRGLDERGRRDVMASGELLRVNEGAVITREGEPADSLFVVVEGALRLESVRRGEASARRLRTVLVGESHGEEALLGALAVRTSRAVAEKPSTVARIPWAVLERCLVRAGGGELVERTTRTLRRAVLRDVWTTSGLVESLDDAEIGLLLDATRHVVLARGEVLLHEGERSLDAFVVIEGLVQVQQDDDGKPRPVAYLGRGDLFGDAELASGEPSSGTFAAAGESWIAAIDGATFGRVFSGREAMIARAHRVTLVGRKRPGVGTTAHAFRDVYRLQIARSLLVIDQDSCARCGHCVWSCGDAHPDGVARIVRRGDKLITGGGDGLAALLVPNSCQHCKNPSCMKECPTGAIGRDARGEVTIREDLCTGCGNCAKGCPWDNIQMAPRLVPRGEKPPAYPEVAVKCDLCSGLEGGPACVAACPTEAIARIEPEAALPALVPSASRGARSASPVPRARPAWPWIAFGASAAVALSRSAMPRVASGALSLGLVMALVAYSALKRRRPAPRRKNQGGAAAASSSSRLRPHYMAHLVLGLLLSGAVVAHGGTRVVASAGGVAGALAAAALATGGLLALAYAWLPPVLSRVERRGSLPEDLEGRWRELELAAFRALSGRSDVVKALYHKFLVPYARAPLGALALVASRRRLKDEERALGARMDAVLEGRGKGKLAGLDELVRIAVDQRALGAERILGGILRGLLPLHVVALASLLVALAVHVAVVLLRSRW